MKKPTPESKPVRPVRSSKARHRSRLEGRLKKKLFQLKKLAERKAFPTFVRAVEQRVERLKKKLAA